MKKTTYGAKTMLTPDYIIYLSFEMVTVQSRQSLSQKFLPRFSKRGSGLYAGSRPIIAHRLVWRVHRWSAGTVQPDRTDIYLYKHTVLFLCLHAGDSCGWRRPVFPPILVKTISQEGFEWISFFGTKVHFFHKDKLIRIWGSEVKWQSHCHLLNTLLVITQELIS